MIDFFMLLLFLLILIVLHKNGIGLVSQKQARPGQHQAICLAV
jgi:hypothetical protein